MRIPERGREARMRFLRMRRVRRRGCEKAVSQHRRKQQRKQIVESKAAKRNYQNVNGMLEGRMKTDIGSNNGYGNAVPGHRRRRRLFRNRRRRRLLRNRRRRRLLREEARGQRGRIEMRMKTDNRVEEWLRKCGSMASAETAVTSESAEAAAVISGRGERATCSDRDEDEDGYRV
ncbi:hypothetical protein NQ318_004029 [Aromia moschata]|uniref:Uncharacterized protein n=1 Tax=Aromia moschata TaxID=1265417 RepID=A0AAV8Z7U4_9CUCU|nr:hypothetical protein NQ318_004029 [Aromia moschata]